MSENNVLKSMIADRRDFHVHPEEGWCEFRTTALIVKRLRELGFEVLVGENVINRQNALGRDERLVAAAQEKALAYPEVDPAIIEEMQGLTGCVAILRTGKAGPISAWRFDIDALRGVTESTDSSHLPAKLGFASLVPNIMHACGHDGHVAVGLAVAKWVMEHKDGLCGTIKLIFQPAEEGVRGAAAMVAQGVVDDCDWLIGSHVGGEFVSNEVGVLTEGYLATTKMDIYFKGTPAHAGSDPEKGRSALLAACATALSIQGLPRHSDGDSRVAVGRVEAGEGRNVVAQHGFLQVEVRGSTKSVNDFLTEEVYRIVRGVSELYGVSGEVIKVGEACRYVCDPQAVEVLLQAAQKVPGLTKVERWTTERGSEDCSLFAERVRSRGGKAGFFDFGCKHQGHHRPDFDIEDEEALLVAYQIFTNAIASING